MKKQLISIIIVLILILSSCGKEGGGSDSGVISVYRPLHEEYRTNGELVRSEKVEIGENADPLQAALYAISALPGSDQLMSILPDGVKIVSVERVGKSAKVSMSPSYISLHGMNKTIADYCITLTMCSISQIDYVSIYVGSDIIESNLTAGNAVLENNVLSPEVAKVRLYFPRLGESGLGYEYREITVSEDSLPERIIMDELLKGPESGSLTASLPDSAVLLSVFTNNGVCSVSFANGFLSGDELTPEQIGLSVYSIVNSLTSLSNVNSVQLLIEGKPTDYIGGIDVKQPLTRKAGMSGFAVID